MHMIECQTWENFQDAAKGREVFLFGAGAAVRYLNGKCDGVKFAGVIDNDKRKQGFRIGDVTGDAVGTRYENLIIYSISILDTVPSKDIVILIINIENYCDIAQQLKPYGAEIFSLVLMESAEKGINNTDILFPGDFIRRREDYTDYCCKQEAIVDNKVLVYIGKYGGHGKNITKALLKSGKILDIVWIVNDLSMEVPEGVRLVYASNWKKYIYEMETAHIWIYDIIIPTYIRKREGQIYIETKHWASITLKKFYLDDVSTTSTEEEIAMVKYNGKLMDYIFCGSEFDKASCRSGFAFQGEFVMTGSARTDTLFDTNNRDKVYAKYKIDQQVRSVLYAPTFRIHKIGNEIKKGEVLDFLALKQTLEKKYGGKWCIMLRLHPSMLADLENSMENDFVIDISGYPDSQELVAACDMLISDYSSIMFEPAFVKKPVFLFAPDRQEYVEKERDLLIEYDTLPFPIAETNEELVMCIEKFDYEDYERTLGTFMQRYGVREDGHASERAAEFILKCLECGGEKSYLMPKITVIMPSLNVAPYIRQCIESVLHQTLEDLEILAVDAGSTDGTLEILEEYAAVDKRLTVIHSNKKSYGCQVNMGLELAKGEYISIVETDDRIAEDMYENLYAVAEHQSLDFVKGRGMFFIDLKNGSQWQMPIWLPLPDDQAGTVVAPCDMPKILERDVFLWNGIYRKDFVKNIRFNESEGAAFQDQGFLLQTISAAKRAMYLDRTVYYYRQDNSGSSVVSPKGFHFLAGEYSYMKQFLTGKEEIWTRMYYLRMLKQCFGRYRSMVIKGQFWEDAVSDILILKEWLDNAYQCGLLKEDIVSTKDMETLKIFLKSERAVFDYLSEEFRQKAEPYRQLMNAVRNKRVVVFGVGVIGRFVQALLENKECGKVAAFCDNDVAVQGDVIQGTHVYSPAEAVEKYSDAVFIITGIKSSGAMREQLQQIAGQNICIYNYIPEMDMRLFLIE